jgi:hypothetical protein
MNDIEKKIKVTGAKQGLLLGVVIMILSIFYFYFVTEMARSAVLLAAGSVFFYLFLPVFIIVFLCFKLRAAIGGYWTFKQATTGIFIMFLSAYFIYLAGMNLVFYKFVEPDYLHKAQVAATNVQTRYMKEKGADQKSIDAKIAETTTEIKQQKDATFGDAVRSVLMYILFIFVFSLLFASLFKKNPPGQIQAT